MKGWSTLEAKKKENRRFRKAKLTTGEGSQWPSRHNTEAWKTSLARLLGKWRCLAIPVHHYKLFNYSTSWCHTHKATSSWVGLPLGRPLPALWNREASESFPQRWFICVLVPKPHRIETQTLDLWYRFAELLSPCDESGITKFHLLTCGPFGSSRRNRLLDLLTGINFIHEQPL